jgi:chaperonin GroEL
MIPKHVLLGNEAREKMLVGINTLADAVKVTLGPKGKNVFIGKKGFHPRLTKDGVSVAREVELPDPIQNFGAHLIRGVANKTCDVAGDGTTTATVLAQHQINNGMKQLAEGYSGTQFKAGMDEAVAAIVSYLDSKVIPVSSKEETKQIATISANGDPDIGEIIADIFDKIGKDGVVTLEESSNGKTTYSFVEGMQIDSGYLSPYFVTNQSKMTCELDNPYVLIYDQKISTVEPMLALLTSIVKENESLLIIAEDVDAEALSTLVLNKLKHNFKIVAVKAPSIGEYRKSLLDDLLIMTGAQFISAETGIKLHGIRKEMLGRAKKVIISEDKTTIVDGNGKIEAINERVDLLKSKIAEEENPRAKADLEKRLASLTNGVAVIKIGGLTDLEMKERRDRIEDAVHATRAAIQEGILAGGGTSLIAAYYAFGDLLPMTTNANWQMGRNIVHDSLLSPVSQILKNAGHLDSEIDSIIEFIRQAHASDNQNLNFGYNAAKDEFCDLIKSGIIDPAKVVKTALKDATSIASLFLTTEAALIEDDEIILDAIKNPLNSIRITN